MRTVVLGAALTLSSLGCVRGQGRLEFLPARDDWLLWLDVPASAMAVADIDQDGDQDLALVSSGFGIRQLTRLLRNDGRGRFTAVAGWLPPNVFETQSILFADLDGDGLPELLHNQAALQVQTNLGGGQFGAARTITLSNSRRVSTLDWGADGDQDVLLTRGVLVVVPNDGAGNLGTPVQLLADVAMHVNLDFDHDGDVDIACLGPAQQPDRVTILRNDRLLGLTLLPQVVVGGPLLTWIEAGDVDGDGLDDVVLVSNETLLVLAGSPQGLQPAAPQPLPGPVSEFCVADLDGDGDCELSLRLAGGRTFLLRNDAGAFTSLFDPALAGWPPIPVLAADLDGDQVRDVVLGTGAYLNHAGGRSLAAGPGLPWLSQNAGAAGDFDGDGIMDVLHAGWLGTQLLRGNGDGSFRSGEVNGGPGNHRTLAADLDGDSDLDAVTDRGGLQTFLNDGRGHFTVTSLNAQSNVNLAAVLDLDRDGHLDVLAVNGAANTVIRARGLGRAAFGPWQVLFTASLFPRSLAVADLDGDADLDLAVPTGSGPHLYLQNAAGQFLPVTVTPFGAVEGFAACDLDGNGLADLVAAVSSGGPRFWMNRGSGTFVDETATRLLTTQWDGTTVTARDMDGDGALDLLMTGGQFARTYVYWNDGTGRFRSHDLILDERLLAAVDVDGDNDTDLLFRNGVALNQTRGIRSRRVPRRGTDIQVEYNWRTAIGPWVAVPLLAMQRLVPGIDVHPYGRIHVDPATALSLSWVQASGPGPVRSSIRVPDAPWTMGLPVFVQAALFDSVRVEFTGVTVDVIL